MRRRLFVPMLVAALLLVLGAIAAACGDDDDGDESDEDAIRNVVQEHVAVFNDRDFDRIAELTTANFETTAAFRTFMNDPNFRLENLEITSVMVAGDEATVTVNHGGSHQSTGDRILLKREDGRWLIDNIF